MLTERQRFLLENEIYRIAKNRLNEWDKKAAQTSHTPEFKSWLDDMEDRYSEIPSKKNKKNDKAKKTETLKEWSSKKGEKADNTSTRKNAVLTWLKNDSTKHSAIAYELWNIGETASEEEKGAARSLFSKKVRNAPNDNGSEYGFTKQ
jgi:hypothetical protein